MASEVETEVFVPCKKVKAVVGAKDFLMLSGGANIMAPSTKPVSPEKGRRLVLDGPKAAQAAAVFAILTRLAPADDQGSFTDPGAKCWKYISPAGKREGPFTARSLLSWLAKGQLPNSFHVQHVPSHVWLPLWLLAHHLDLLAATSGTGRAGAYGPMAWPVPLVLDTDVVMTDVELMEEIRQLRHEHGFQQAIVEVVAMEVDSTGLVSLPPGLSEDTQALLHVSELLQLHLPTPMDIDIAIEAVPLLPVAPVAAVASARPRLYLVVDTNVLLLRDGVALLKSVRQRFAPCSSGRKGEPVAEAEAPLSCVAVVPWAVLVELDGLKSGGAGGGRGGRKLGGGRGSDGGSSSDDERPVAAMARSALSLLRSALDSGDCFYTGQTLQQFREASCHPAATIPLGPNGIKNDDRILQCCLQLQADLAAKSEATGRRCCVALLSNDNALCVKARVCSVPSVSTPQLFAPSAPPAATTDPEPDLLTSALLRLLEGNANPSSVPASGSGSGFSSASVCSSSSTPASVQPANGGLLSPASVSPASAERRPQEHTVAAAVRGSGGPFIVRVSGGDNRNGKDNGNDDTNGPLVPVDGLVGEFDLDEEADPLVAALHGELQRLTIGLAPVIRDIMQAEYEELWTSVMERPPPWGGADMLEVLHRHWRSTFADKLDRMSARDLSGYVDKMLKDVRFFERGRGRPRREARLLQVADDFGRGVDSILQAFGVFPPPARPLPAALLMLQGGQSASISGLTTRRSAPSTVDDLYEGPPQPPLHHLQGTMSGGGGGLGVRSAAAAAPSLSDAGGQPRQLHPAVLRAAALAQSIGLSVNLSGTSAKGGAAGAGGCPSSAGGAAAAGQGTGMSHLGRASARTPPGGGGGGGGDAASAGGNRQEHAAAAAEAAARGGAGGPGAGSAAAVLSLEAAVASQLQATLLANGGTSGDLEPQVMRLLQQITLLQQQQQRQQQQVQQQQLPHHPNYPQHSHHYLQQQQAQAIGASSHEQLLCTASEDGRIASLDSGAHMQYLLLNHQQQQHMLGHTVQRLKSDPPPAGEGTSAAAAVGAAAGGGGGIDAAAIAALAAAAAAPNPADSRAQAEAAARHLQLLQLQHHQQQQQQVALQLLAQKAAAQVEAQAQAERLLARSASDGSHSGATSGAGSALSPTGTMAVAPGAHAGGAAQSVVAWQALFAESHQRQQQRQQQQQLQQLLQQQQRQHQHMLQQLAAVEAHSAASGGGETAGGADVAAALRAAMAAAALGQVHVEVGTVGAMGASGAGRRASDVSCSSMATD